MKRKNIDILLNTKVSRVLRNGPAVYGVEIETSASLPTSEGMVTIHVRNGLKAAAQRGEAHPQKLGKVILSAGALESPKILFRSGIGPRDVLETVQNNTAVGQLIEEKQWVDLPVGSVDSLLLTYNQSSSFNRIVASIWWIMPQLI